MFGKKIWGLGLAVMAVWLMAAMPYDRVAGPHRDEPGDTVKAVVQYGDEYLFRTVDDVNSDYFDRILDSLEHLQPRPEDKIKEIKFYQRIPQLSTSQVNALIDSLFDLDTVPYALINEINLYVATHETMDEVQFAANYVFVPVDTFPYPAHSFYKKWSTRETHPYPSQLSAQDSSLMLRMRAPEANCEFAFPLEGEIKLTSKFGYRDGRNHNGVDLDLHVWDPVKTAFAGMVRYARFHEGYGRLVIVRHHNGLETYYAHLHRLKVKPGDIVEAGDVIGLGGSSGHSTGSHLHFEMRFKGVPIDPSHVISFDDGSLIGDTLVLRKTRRSYIAFPRGTVFHTVKRGDSIYRIAKRYGVSVEQIKALNGFSRRTHLRVGQQVRVSNTPLNG